MRALACILVVIGAVGCSGPGGPGGGDLEATFRGEPLTLTSGIATTSWSGVSMPEQGDGLWIRFSDEDVDCGHDEPILHFDSHLVRVEIPVRESGTHTNAMVWVQSGAAALGGRGTVEVDIGETEVTGTVEYQSSDGEAVARGSFRVPRCFE